MTKGIKFQTKIHFRCRRNGQQHLEIGEAPAEQLEPGRVPRVSRIMALAIRFDRLVREGAMTDQAEVARLGHVTRARVTQVMNLLHLAPNIQEDLLFLPRVKRGRDPIQERQLRSITAVPDWRKQRKMWVELQSRQCR